MPEIKTLSYQNDDGTKVFFNNNSNISEELDRFLSDKKLDKAEQQALHYILYNHTKEEILKSSDNLSELANQLKYIPIQSDRFHIKSRINRILKLENNKNYNYRSLKNESIKLGTKKIKLFQRIIGTKDDGKFGPNTFRKYKKYNKNWKNEGIRTFLKKNQKKLEKNNVSKLNFLEKIFGNSNKGKVDKNINKNSNLENASKRTKNNIENLSNKYNFKENVINFYNELFNLGYKIEIIEGKRNLAQQKEKVKKGWSKTIDSAHVKGLAIDVLYNGSNKLPLKIKQIAAQNGLINGYEMWGWDSGHFQAYYQGDLSKKDKRFARMKKRGTLPKGYLV